MASSSIDIFGARLSMIGWRRMLACRYLTRRAERGRAAWLRRITITAATARSALRDGGQIRN